MEQQQHGQKDNVLTAPFNIYSSCDSNPYLYNTPPVPTNTGYYNGTRTGTANDTTTTNHNYYGHQPNTTPSHILQHNQHQHTHSTLLKSADIYGHHNNYQQQHIANNNNNSNYQQQWYPSHQHQQQQQVTTTYINNNHYNQQSPYSHSSHHQHFNHQQSPKAHQPSTASNSSPNSDPLTVAVLSHNFNNRDDETDAFTAGFY